MTEEHSGSIDAAFVSIVIQRLDQLGGQIESDRLNSEESRRRMHEKLDGHEKMLWGLDHRMEVMERAVTSTSPVFTEFMAYKQRVIGAGMVGRWLWWIGGIILTAAASIAATYAWVASHFTIPK